MSNTFYKTVNYFKSSHFTPRVQSSKDLLKEEFDMQREYEIRKMQETIAQEIKKFNKTKQQKQREAKENYDEEMKKMKMA